MLTRYLRHCAPPWAAGQLSLMDLDQDDYCLQGVLDMFTAEPCDPLMFGMPCLPPLALPSDPCEPCSSAPTKAPKRKVGRPRISRATSAPDSQGTETPSSGAGREREDGELGKRRGRGPRPKYHYRSAEEAADARRERNRKAALESYYRKRDRAVALQEEQERLAQENAALERLLEQVESGAATLSGATEEAVDAWLRGQGCA